MILTTHFADVKFLKKIVLPILVDMLMKSLWTIIVIIILLPGCAARKNINKKNFSKISKIKTEHLKIVVTGVECEHCAASLNKHIKKINGIISTCYVPKDNYASERGELYLEYDPKVLMATKSIYDTIAYQGFVVNNLV